MRLISLITLVFSFLMVNAQLLQPQSNWFDLENFFNQSALKEHRIEAIHIKIENKKDGEIIRHKGNFLHYEFDKHGRLVEALKSIPLAGKIDTSKIVYSYDHHGKLFKKTESYGPFQFAYYYFYSQDLLTKELKIDLAKAGLDTLYERSFDILKEGNTEIIKTLNSSAKAYKSKRIEKNDKGKITLEKTNFSRGNSFRETLFKYEEERLVETITREYFDREIVESKEILYDQDKIEFIKLYKAGELIKKRAFTFRKDGLPSAVIERDYKEKSIRIYSFLYRFF